MQIHRLLYSATVEKFVMLKFVDEIYHVEDDYFFQRSPVLFNTFLNCIIAEYDGTITNELAQEKC